MNGIASTFDFQFDHPFGGEMEIVRLEGSEGFSELFEFSVEFVDKDIDASALSSDDAIGKELHVGWKFDWAGAGFTDGSAPERDVHGLCTDFHFLGKLDQLNHYEVTLRPKLWLATRKTNSRFFIDMSVKDIVETVLNEHGISGSTISFEQSDAVLHYTVQYQETDFDFISRLLEKYGATYRFKHTSSAHDLDIRNADGKIGDAGELDLLPDSSGIRTNPYLNNVTAAAHLRSNTGAVRDWDPESAGAALEGEDSITLQHASGQNEIYVYPAGWDSQNSSHGNHLAGMIAKAEIAHSKRLFASGYVPNILIGDGFKVKDSPFATDEYILLRAQHRIEVWAPSGSAGEGRGYHGTYEAIPSDLKYPPLKTTPWPRISGPQTAKVAGEGEIDIDEDGRILVHFHWDRDQNDSCRIRVAQLWAGNQWGAVFVPRVGMEVVVEFMGGDPDRPLVTGAVYNSVNKNPVLPEKKTRSGIRSESSEGGGGYNFIGFDDLKGSEEVYIHAQKDMLREVENNDTIRVIEGDRTITVEQGNQSTTVSQGNHSTTVSQGNLTVSVDAGKIEVEAAQSIELKVGGSSIKIEPAKITLKSVQIEINGSAQTVVKGTMVQVDGSAMTEIKGGMVKIN